MESTETSDGDGSPVRTPSAGGIAASTPSERRGHDLATVGRSLDCAKAGVQSAVLIAATARTLRGLGRPVTAVDSTTNVEQMNHRRYGLLVLSPRSTSRAAPGRPGLSESAQAVKAASVISPQTRLSRRGHRARPALRPERHPVRPAADRTRVAESDGARKDRARPDSGRRHRRHDLPGLPALSLRLRAREPLRCRRPRGPATPPGPARPGKAG
jgi:hypothetical protein